MQVSIRNYTGAGNRIGSLAALIRHGLVPRLGKVHGFRGFCAFASEDGHLVSVTICANRDSRARAEEEAGAWAMAELGDQAAGQAELIAGETLLHEVAAVQRDGGPAMFVTLRVFEGLGPKEEVLPRVREHVFLTITGAAGFRGYYAFLDEQRPSRGVSVSLFDSRSHAMEANARVVSVMRDRQIAPQPPRLLVGPAAVVAAA